MAVLIGLVGVSFDWRGGRPLFRASDADVSIVRQVKIVRVRAKGRGRNRKEPGKNDLFQGLDAVRGVAQGNPCSLFAGRMEGNLIRRIPSMRDVQPIVNF